MSTICEIAQRCLKTGWLSIPDEENLRRSLQNRYGLEEFHAFMQLQRAAMEGRVKQESRIRISGREQVAIALT